MGWLKDIVKGVGNVITGIVKGIGKLFGAVLKPIGKFLNTGWGKALLLAVSVFTFGAALIAGGQAFMGGLAANQGFISSFVEGGKAFVGSLLGTTQGGGKELAVGAGEGGTGAIVPGSAEAFAEAGQGASMAQRAITEGVPDAASAAGNLVSGGALTQAEGALSTSMASNVAGVAGPTQSLAKAGGSLAKKAMDADKGNWLTKAAKGAWDFAKSDAGQNLIGSGLEGYAAGERDQAWFDHQARYDRMWQDPSRVKPITDLAENFRPDVPNIWNRDPAALARQRNRDYVPSVPYTRAPQGAGG